MYIYIYKHIYVYIYTYFPHIIPKHNGRPAEAPPRSPHVYVNSEKQQHTESIK